MADDTHSDAELLAAFRRGDAGAFERLYHRHRGFVLRVALRFCDRDEHEAFDVLQEAFTWLVRKAPTLRLRHPLPTLLYPVVRHLARDRRRRRERDPEPLLHPDELASPLPGEDPTPAPADEALGDWLRGLGPLQREVLTLRFGDDLSLDEIADALDVPLGTVKSRLHHAIRQLRERDGEPPQKNPIE